MIEFDGEVLVIDEGEAEHSQLLYSYLRKRLECDLSGKTDPVF